MIGSSNDHPVLIAGGGIAGMTLALSLASRGIASQILEARPQLSEAGAGIQLGPNATRILSKLEVAGHLAESSTAPHTIVVRDARSGADIARLPLGDWIAKRHGAPYWVTHRRDLQAALHARVKDMPLIKMQFGYAVEGVTEHGDGITVTAADGRTSDGKLLVGADGIWSRVRGFVQPDYALNFSGMMAVRALAAMDHVPEVLRDNATGVWLMADAHIVKYPVESGSAVALVIIAPQSSPELGWESPVDVEHLTRGLGPVNADLQVLISAAREWRRWSLYDTPPMASWSRGNVMLIGDAAHPILPFLAQGGGMAIEDGFVLGHLIADHHGSSPALAWRAFEAQRMSRVGRVQKASRQNGQIYHLGGLAAAARNFTMKTAPAVRLMQRYDWVYNWQFDAALGEVEL